MTAVVPAENHNHFFPAVNSSTATIETRNVAIAATRTTWDRPGRGPSTLTLSGNSRCSAGAPGVALMNQAAANPGGASLGTTSSASFKAGVIALRLKALCG